MIGSTLAFWSTRPFPFAPTRWVVCAGTRLPWFFVFQRVVAMVSGLWAGEAKRRDEELQHNNIDATLLGKIMLARFLELPLRSFDRFVARVESSAEFSALAQSRRATATTVPDVLVELDMGDRSSCPPT